MRIWKNWSPTLLVGMKSGAATEEKFGGSSKGLTELPYDPLIPILGI